ncbi:hypothetical protein ABHC31_20445, partial [Escherichia coli]
EWVHVQLHQQKGMISLSPPTICNSARSTAASTAGSIISVAGRYYSSPESLSRAGYSETTRTKISIVPADIFESFLLTLASVVTEHYVL